MRRHRGPTAGSLSLLLLVALVVPVTSPAGAAEAALPRQPAPIAATYVSGKGSPHDFTLFVGARGARWDPTMIRNGHSGRVINWHYRTAGNRGRVSAGRIEQALKPLAAATGFTFRRVASAKNAELKYRWDTMPAVDLAMGRPDYIVRYPGDAHYTISDGTVRLNIRRDWNLTWNQWREVLMHETSHVLGLGHAREGNQVMHPYIHGITRLGRGDVAGLRTVGIWRGAVR